VDEITCITTKRSKRFETPLGRFSYRHLAPRAFAVGVALVEGEGGNYFLASPEKALCDRIALARGLSAQRDVPRVLEEELRVELDRVGEFDLGLVAEIARLYRRSAVDAFAGWLGRPPARGKKVEGQAV
jgi:hypothetical protein